MGSRLKRNASTTRYFYLRTGDDGEITRCQRVIESGGKLAIKLAIKLATDKPLGALLPRQMASQGSRSQCHVPSFTSRVLPPRQPELFVMSAVSDQ